MTYFHIIEEIENEVGYQGLCFNKNQAEKTVTELESRFEKSFFYIHESDNENEPPFITL